MRRFRFVFIFENSNLNDLIGRMLPLALMAGAVPIYA
jgi:hypothetical protein